ncbi:MAG: GNAT family protein, partial [Candidatus Thermoplasmatota archaeon]|nr:GNAT family protein [Candidatus Thermoplasmatota archaeon]
KRVWRYMTTHVERLEDLKAWVHARCDQVEQGRALAFLQRDGITGQAVGSTSIFDIEPEHRTMEIGHTWLVHPAWGTGINAEAKLLLLTHCFQALEAVRVQIKTDARNERSRAAIHALGASEEGTLRRQRRMPDGHLRDAVVYSILDQEWPACREALEARVAVVR